MELAAADVAPAGLVVVVTAGSALDDELPHAARERARAAADTARTPRLVMVPTVKDRGCWPLSFRASGSTGAVLTAGPSESWTGVMTVGQGRRVPRAALSVTRIRVADG